MVFYYFLLLFIVLLIPIKINKKIKQVIYFFILFIVSGLRYGIGSDYFSYSSIYCNINNLDFNTLINSDSKVEKGYIFLNKIVGMISSNPQTIFLVCSFIIIFFVMKSSIDYCENYEISIILFIMLGYYHSSFNIMRQYIAIAIFLFAIRYVISKRFLNYFFLILVAALFHSTAIFLLPIYFIGNKSYSKIILIFISTLSLFSNLFYTAIITKVLPVLSKSYFDLYGGSNYFQQGIDGVHNYFLIAVLYILILFCIFKKDKLTKFKYGNFCLNMIIISLPLLVLGTKSLLIFRLSLYFSIFLIFLLPSIPELFQNRFKIIIWCLIIIISTFCYNFTLESRDQCIPYKWNYDYIQLIFK